MSYILDALRRADAERQRGAVPGLHDQTGPLGADGQATRLAAPGGGTGRGLWWLAGAGLLLLALAAAWWLGRGTAAPGRAMPAADKLVVLPPPPPAQPAAQPMATAPTQPLMPVPSPAPAPVPPQAPARQPVPVAPPTATPLATPPAAPPPVALPATAAPQPDPAPSEPVRSWASLPESQRAALPPLAWSGLVYAERAEQRLVVVNGQVAREGEQLASGLQLLQIRPKSVLLRWQGQRIEVPL